MIEHTAKFHGIANNFTIINFSIAESIVSQQRLTITIAQTYVATHFIYCVEWTSIKQNVQAHRHNRNAISLFFISGRNNNGNGNKNFLQFHLTWLHIACYCVLCVQACNNINYIVLEWNIQFECVVFGMSTGFIQFVFVFVWSLSKFHVLHSTSLPMCRAKYKLWTQFVWAKKVPNFE